VSFTVCLQDGILGAGSSAAMEAAHDETIRAGGLELRRSDGLVLAGGQVVQTSVRELRLLVALVDRWGRIVSREELYRLAWGGTLRGGDRSVDVYVHKLRVKLEQALPEMAFIHTHPGFGYRFEPASHVLNRSTTPR
jgi:DNA-binding response OmpR family regulator